MEIRFIARKSCIRCTLAPTATKSKYITLFKKFPLETRAKFCFNTSVNVFLQLIVDHLINETTSKIDLYIFFFLFSTNTNSNHFRHTRSRFHEYKEFYQTVEESFPDCGEMRDRHLTTDASESSVFAQVCTISSTNPVSLSKNLERRRLRTR